MNAPVSVLSSDHTHNTAKMIKSQTSHPVLPCNFKFGKLTPLRIQVTAAPNVSPLIFGFLAS